MLQNNAPAVKPSKLNMNLIPYFEHDNKGIIRKCLKNALFYANIKGNKTEGSFSPETIPIASST